MKNSVVQLHCVYFHMLCKILIKQKMLVEFVKLAKDTMYENCNCCRRWKMLVNVGIFLKCGKRHENVGKCCKMSKNMGTRVSNDFRWILIVTDFHKCCTDV